MLKILPIYAHALISGGSYTRPFLSSFLFKLYYLIIFGFSDSEHKKRKCFDTRNMDHKTMMQAGKMNEIVTELNKLNFNIAVLQEIRWKDAGTIERKDYILFYNRTLRKSGQKGIGFWVNRETKY